MNNKIFGKSFFFGKAALVILTVLFAATFLNAQTTRTFAQFNQRTNGQDFVFTNNSSSAAFQTVNGGTNNGAQISFTYLGVTGLPAELQGPQNARLILSATTTASAVTAAGTRVIQPFNALLTIQIVRETPYNGRTNLLTATVTPSGASNAELTGDQGASSAGFSASTPVQNIAFTSDFVSFSGSSNRDLGLSFSSVSPQYGLGTNFVNSFAAAGTGTFAVNQIPFFFVPTAAAISVSGRVLTPKGRGLANARVTLTGSAGEVLTAWTDNSGYYRFPEVVAGDTVIINVKSKLYSFGAQILNLSEETNDLNFVAQYASAGLK